MKLFKARLSLFKIKKQVGKCPKNYFKIGTQDLFRKYETLIKNDFNNN